MTFFFLVVGLEAKRELDLGELRERRRLTIPVLAALGGMALPVAIYLAFNAGGPGAHGWGAAMSTDTAFALGRPGAADAARRHAAARLPADARRRRRPLRAAGDRDRLHDPRLAPRAGDRGGALRRAARAPLRAGVAPPGVDRCSRSALWVAMFESGIDPVISGLAVGLATSAYPPSREDLERATALTRSFREQPTPELARSAQQGVLSAISPNERLQYSLHPWTSYVVVPLFALANAGVHVTGGLLEDAIRSPITLGILVGYVVGKPLGIVGASWLASRPALRGPRSPLSPPAARRRRGVRGDRLHGLAADLEPRLHRTSDSTRPSSARSARCCSRPLLGWTVLRVVRRLPAERASAPDRRHGRGHPRPLRGRRSRARPHPRARRRARHARRVRRLRVPLLRAGRGGHPRAARLLRRRRALRLAPPAAQRRPPQRAARRRGLGGRRRPGPLLGDARHPARPPGRAAAGRTCSPTPRQLGLDAERIIEELRHREYALAGQRGRRQRRRERRLGHARPSSSTDAATTARTTSPRSPTP